MPRPLTCIALALAVAACGEHSRPPAVTTDQAVDDTVEAKTDADRAAAKARLEQLRKEKAALEKRMSHDWYVVPATQRRVDKMDNHCLDNPLEAGCN